MAQSTPLRPLATLDAVTFRFPPASGVDVVVNFYDSAGALIAPGSGSIDITVARPVSSFAGDVSNPTRLPDIEAQPISPTQTCLANEINTVSLGGMGDTVIKLTPSNVVPPGGGVFYTMKVLAPQTRAPDPLT